MAGLNVIVDNSNGKGKGLFAEVDFNEGDVIFNDKLLVSSQFSWNKVYKYEACDHCLRSLETAEDACRRLTQDDGLILPHSECCKVNKKNHTSCELCGAKYCSADCKEKAALQYHNILCLCEQNPKKDDLLTLDEIWRQIHYPSETASIMLVARMIAIVKQSSKKDDVLKKFQQFCHKTENEEEKIVHKLMGEKFLNQIETVRTQLKNTLFEESLEEWFTEEGFRSLLALLGTNQQGIGSSSLSDWVKNCDDLNLGDVERAELDTFIDNLYEKLEEVSGEFLNCEGVGLYPLQSACNHSCDPDAEISFEHGDYTLTLRALKPILSGSEIHITYLGECDLARSRHSRQKVLSENYLFNCHCVKCEDQAGDLDLTSDEEMTDDES